LDNKALPGLLNVREKPNIKSKVLMQVPRNTILWMGTGIDTHWDISTDWANVRGGRYGDEDDQIVPEGWVSKKYLKWVECPKSLNEQETTMPDEMLEDWCKRNDPNLTAQSCIELKSKTHIKRECYPKWVGLNRC
jgi:hypothetical protein